MDDLNVERFKVSCLCVTDGRPTHLRRAINCFLVQGHKNKELVVVYMSDDIQTKEVLKEYSFPFIVLVELNREDGYLLGELRNKSIEAATGDFICTWDDDDVSNSNRIALQLNALRGSGRAASVLEQIIVYNEGDGSVYSSISRPWEQTLMCLRSFLIENDLKYMNLPRGEDSPLIYELIKRDQLRLFDEPNLYVYVVHGKNTWDPEHYNPMFSYSNLLTSKHTDILRLIYDDFFNFQENIELLNSEFFVLHIKFIKCVKSLGFSPMDINLLLGVDCLKNPEVDYLRDFVSNKIKDLSLLLEAFEIYGLPSDGHELSLRDDSIVRYFIERR